MTSKALGGEITSNATKTEYNKPLTKNVCVKGGQMMPKFGNANYTVPALLVILFIQAAAVLTSVGVTVGVIYVAIHFIHKLW